MKKKLLIFLSSICVITVLLFGVISFMMNQGYGISRGKYLEAKNGQPMMILNNSPIQLSDRKKLISFEKLSNGDEIFVIHDAIEESYPGRTGVHAVFKLGDGSAADIPREVISSLIELGWLESEF